MIDQLEEINKRNDLIIQNIDDFIEKTNKMKENIEQMKNECLINKESCEDKLNQFSKTIVNYYQQIEDKELNKIEEERRKIEEKFAQLKNPFTKHIKNTMLNGILESTEMK